METSEIYYTYLFVINAHMCKNENDMRAVETFIILLIVLHIILHL